MTEMNMLMILIITLSVSKLFLSFLFVWGQASVGGMKQIKKKDLDEISSSLG